MIIWIKWQLCYYPV